MAYVVLLVLLASVLPYVYGSILLRSAVHSISSPSAALCDDLWAEPLLSLFGHVRHDDRTPIKNVPITITFQGNIVGVSVHDGKTVKIVALANETMHMFTDQDGRWGVVMTLEIDAIDPQGHFSDHNIFANLTLHLDYGPQHVPLSPLPYFGASVVLHVLERAIVLDQTLYRADSQWIYPHFSGMAKRTSRQSSAQKAYSALQEQLYITVRDIRTTVPMHVAFLATLQMPSRRNFELLVLLSILVGAMGWTAGMLHPGRSGSSAKTSCEFRVHPWSSQALSFWIKRRGRPVEGKTKHGRHPAVRADTKEVPEKPKKVETSESAKTMKKLELAIMVHHSPTEFAKKTAVTRASTLHNMSSPQLARYFNERGGKMSGKRVGTM